jgi:hypothetical protein
MGYHLGAGKEVFNAELYAILEATRRFSSKGYNKNSTVSSDSQSAILRRKNDCVVLVRPCKSDHATR